MMSTDQATSVGSKLVDVLFWGVKTAAAFGLDHEVTREVAEEIHAIMQSAGIPRSLQLVADAAYLDRELIAIRPDDYSKVHVLLKVFGNLGVDELSIRRVPSAPQLLRLLEVLTEGLIGPSRAAEDQPVPGLVWRAIPTASVGGSCEVVDDEMLAITQLSLAISDAERAEAELAKAGTWLWESGLSAVRRLERGLTSDPSAVLRALELSPGEWSAARRAVGVARCVQQALDIVDSPASLVRATGHAALAAALVSFVHGPSLGLANAARQILPEIEGDRALVQETTPHRLRVATVLRSLCASDRRELAEVAALVEVAHTLESWRVSICPGGIAPRIDLLALGLERVESPWVKVIINMERLLPPGAQVQLHDGRGAVVLGAGDPLDPWRPLVIAGADVFIPEQPVRVG
ncbi:MAG: hypothetical protein AAGF11_25375 [Myxococcota bacterium]